MDIVDLARLQFALTAGAHFLFVALTLGLATLVAVVQTRATFSGDPVHLRMTRFWGQLYIINYAMGIVTGLVMEFQLGLSWSGLTEYAGDVFGSALAIETLVAFFVESTFLGLWIFGWDKLNRWAHLALIWGVTLTAYASAFWIMVANGFLQHPVGHVLENGRLRLTDFGAMVANPAAQVAFGHVLSGAMVVGGFFMAGVSAYHLRKRTAEQDVFRKSLRIGIGLALPGLFVTATFGGIGFQTLQPTKAAAWVNNTERLAAAQAEMVARLGPGDYLPPAGAVQAGGITMLTLFAVMLFVAAPSFLLMLIRPVVHRFRLWHWLLTLMIPVPFVTMLAGWVFREMGRQPWAVYGLLRTSDAMSPVTWSQMVFSLAGFVTVFAALIAVNYWLLARQARRGPGAVALGDRPVDVPVPAPTF
ncbi:Cytochrome d ubiquinol oxidase subunit I [[Actinomadura] parvosata subsp. kistnae]|uniref:Cytochrome ubiquinol oxidase subunit I n=1 Tax=[Actinomadura] parvosata subsp. kistnae TaxID=1909395 RepID=A0A1V0ADX4_9ACTN|nr:cytochrome ubiquinol oxidase subunit I [Nonomuraea sp. ATCC 55076]AQZ68418.1 cytochrome ubiquinol oxidase subunit I [Nonomuraea sp. ATCC 55076]SPL93139.1 Cytochrome d ubiquinol oxidase subunit I [Actinomadura parvosata subsp. kistnae]